MLALRRPILPPGSIRAALISLATMTVVLTALLFLASAALVEITDFSPLSLRTYILVTALLAAALLLLIVAFPRRPFILGLAAFFILYAGSLTTLALIPWGPRKIFLHRLDQIHPGMTIPDVDRLMAGYPRAQGPESGPLSWSPPTATTPTPEVLLFRHDITDGSYDADVATVHLHNAHVTSTDFLPD